MSRTTIVLLEAVAPHIHHPMSLNFHLLVNRASLVNRVNLVLVRRVELQAEVRVAPQGKTLEHQIVKD